MKETSIQYKISIITVVLNGEKYLEETIKSVINQTYKNIEYIIIDGGSIDGTIDIIKKYQDKIAYWVSEPDKGIYDAMNKAIGFATGGWMNFMNAGDLFESLDTVKNVEGLLDDTLWMIYGNTIYMYEDYTIKKKPINLNRLYQGMLFCHQSTFIKSSYHKKNYFNLEYDISADYEFILKSYILDSEKLYYIPLTISKFMISDSGVSRDNPLRTSNQKIEILKSFNRYGKKERVYYFILALKIIIKSILPNSITSKIIKFKNRRYR